MLFFSWWRSGMRIRPGRRLTWGLALSCALAASGWAGSAGGVPPAPVVVNVDAENPPFMYSTSGHPAGLYPDLIREVFAHTSFRVQLKAVPWRRALGDLEAGSAGVGGVYKTRERAARYDYSDPIYVERIVVVYADSQPIRFRSLADLEGRRVGVMSGWSYGEAFDRAVREGRVHASAATSDRQNLGKLVLGRLDAALLVEESALTLVQQAGYRNVRIAAIPLTENPTYLAFNKSAGATALLQAFNRQLRLLKRSPRYGLLVSNALASPSCAPHCAGRH